MIKLTKIVNSVTVSLVVLRHQIDSLALTQASVKQLPGSSDVKRRAVSIGSSF